jgi:Tol biopolymer transport system component
MLEAARKLEVVDGDFAAAIRQYQAIVDRFGKSDRGVAAAALLRMAEAHQKVGNAEAQRIYQRIVREYADQSEPATQARARLATLASPSVEPRRLAARQIWAGSGVDASGHPSPDGRYLSFTDWSTGDLALRDLASNTSRRLTNTGGWAASGDFVQGSLISPDGRHVLYGWFVESERTNELRVLPIGDEAARPRVVLRARRWDYYDLAAFTPDGSQVAVVRRSPDETIQIGLVSLSDGSYRSVKSLEWRDPERVSVSPDGRYLAYDVPAGEKGSPRDILILAVDGSRETVAVASAADDYSPTWAPDGGQLVFLSNRTGNLSLWSVPVESGRVTAAPVMLKADIGQINPLGITRNGTLFYGLSGRARENIYVAPLDGLNATNAPVLATERFVNASSGPAWSPDGESLAFFSLRPRPPTLVVRSMKTGVERRVAVPPGLVAFFGSGPRWFPDGRSVLIMSDDGSSRRLHRLHLDSGQTDLLHSISTWASSFVLSPDGQTIYWAVQSTSDENQSSGRLMRFDIETRRETVLKRDEWFITVAISPDGAQLAYLKTVRTPEMRSRAEYPSMVEVMPSTGGQAREVFRDATWLSGARYNTLAWASDQQHLLFVRQDGLLWSVPVTGGEPRKMGISMNARIKSPAVHPDGKSIVFGTFEADNEIWALENFLGAAIAKR